MPCVMPSPSELARLRESFPTGSRVVLVSMGDDDPRPVDPGTEGTIIHVDDMGTVHVVWDCGRMLGAAWHADVIRRLG